MARGAGVVAVGAVARHRILASLIALAVAAGGAAGCSSGSKAEAGGASASPSASASAGETISAPCIKPGSADAKQIVHLPVDGAPLEAYVSSPAAGKQVSSSGTVGIVIAHQALQTLCETMPWAAQFSELGYLAIAPTIVPNQEEDDVNACVAYLRAHGATQIVLLGGSMGGTAVLQAATELTPPVKAVVSVSGPATYLSLDALSTAPKLTVPVFYSAGGQDTEFATDETNMYKATTEHDKTLDIVPGSALHGFALLKGLLPKVEAFLQSHIS